MGYDRLEQKGYRFVAKGHKPLCVTGRGLLTWHKHGLYLYQDSTFSLIYRYQCSAKARLMESIRLFERLTRSEPQSAVSVGDTVFIARRNGIYTLDLRTGDMSQADVYRKNYIHTNLLNIIKGVSGFADSVVYGEYLSNPKREEVCVYQKKLGDSTGFREVYRFAAGRIRHIHNLVPDSRNSCVYILTGDEDGESGIWRATENFRKVEPVLVGDQQYRSCLAFVNGDKITYATDIPSRENMIATYDMASGDYRKVITLPGTCTRGCQAGECFVFATSVEAVEPSSRSKGNMLRYWFSRKRAVGILDDYPRLFVQAGGSKPREVLKLKKDMLPPGAFRFGRILPIYDDNSNVLYIYPIAVKKYDGKLFCINRTGIR